MTCDPMFDDLGLESGIMKNIPVALCRYLVDFLEVPHRAFGNMPPCPFAQKERISKRIQPQEIVLDRGSPDDRLHEIIRSFAIHPTFRTLLVYDQSATMSATELEEVGQRIMDDHPSMLVIALHPEEGFAPAGVHTRRAPFPALVIQDRDQLSDAQITLLRTAYYDNIAQREERMIRITQYQCSKHQLFIPVYWWKKSVLERYADVDAGEWPEEIIGETVQPMTCNGLHVWMGDYGVQLGWSRYGDFSSLEKAQKEISRGNFFLATAHGGKGSGYVELLGKSKPRKGFFAAHFVASTLWKYTSSSMNV